MEERPKRMRRWGWDLSASPTFWAALKGSCQWRRGCCSASTGCRKPARREGSWRIRDTNKTCRHCWREHRHPNPEVGRRFDRKFLFRRWNPHRWHEFWLRNQILQNNKKKSISRSFTTENREIRLSWPQKKNRFYDRKKTVPEKNTRGRTWADSQKKREKEKIP